MKKRFAGCLLGLACGDALGAAVEFQPPSSFLPLTDLVGGGPFHLAPGQWTDDTAMALCLADSLIHCNGFDARDQMERYCRWRDEGLWSTQGFALISAIPLPRLCGALNKGGTRMPAPPTR